MVVLTESNVEDYLKQGMYGPKETNPDERRKYLGTLRERIEMALTKAQVMEKRFIKKWTSIEKPSQPSFTIKWTNRLSLFI